MNSIEETTHLSANDALVEYFRCPPDLAQFRTEDPLPGRPGFFRFGADTTYYGRSIRNACRIVDDASLPDLAGNVRFDGSLCWLPFDPAEVATNLRREKYVSAERVGGWRGRFKTLERNVYYLIRPLLGVAVRKYLQRASLKGWEKKTFPKWPVDTRVDKLFACLLSFVIRAQRVNRVPFIWFWPEGCQSAVVITHDVEEQAGVDFCSALLDLDGSFGFKSSFQFIPEGRYPVPLGLLDLVRGKGFEVNVHDLNHDGHLYDDQEEFLRRAAKINDYVRGWGVAGFRSGVLYRNLDWYDTFTFSYDMSVPNVGHLDPQPGGCCTVMPYFVGKILELPLTTTQDYSLFHVISDFSIELWKRQIGLIAENHGLISFNTHPDYLIEEKARKTYKELLKHLSSLRSENNFWHALPGQVDRWWRARSQMRLVPMDGHWTVEGPQKERARIAFATLRDGKLHYEIERDPSTA